jgi:ATP-dependent helicase HrpB
LQLPVDLVVPEILDRLREPSNLVIEAAPGAGKTTRVPPALLELAAAQSGPQHVLVLEPRRLAARLAARFIAGQRGEPVGAAIGYQVRFEEVAGPQTRLRFVTEGVLTRMLLSNPTLSGVWCVILDEFHERHLEGDLALSLLLRLQRTARPDLRLVAMSATLDAEPVANFLKAAIVRSEGRQHPLEIEYTPHSAEPLEDRVRNALERSTAASPGHTLVFLPGAAEIRRAQSACAALARRNGWTLAPLHGDQSPEEQDRAITPSQTRKIILSTNVAESSVTIEGVNLVIDSGLARAAGHSPWSGLPTLEIARVSQASANQRAGRAGRTGPGRAIRLYPLEDFVRRPAHTAPEVLRADLTPAALTLRALGLESFGALEWLDAPPASAVAHAEDLLRQLGAEGAAIREMSRYPVHPRLARLIVEAAARGVAEDGAAIAALLSSGERLPPEARHAGRSDLLALLESQWSPRAEQTVRQLRRMIPRRGQTARAETNRDDALLISALAAFPDRVARRRQGATLQLASGGAAQLAPSSTVAVAEYLIAVEAEDRGGGQPPLVRLASAIEPEWLIDLFAGRVGEVSRLEWNRATQRVEEVSALQFGEIAIGETRREADPEASAALLAEKAIEAGIERFADADELARLLERARFASAHSATPALPEDAVDNALREIARGLRGFAQLEEATRTRLIPELRRQLPRDLDEIAPETLRLPGGRQVRVHYEPSQPPWIASRLQDFFGMRETPRIARGKVPVVVRLLAPSQRPVQTTTDLAGFWERLYPEIRKELSRRYPKHRWPEKP